MLSFDSANSKGFEDNFECDLGVDPKLGFNGDFAEALDNVSEKGLDGDSSEGFNG